MAFKIDFNNWKTEGLNCQNIISFEGDFDEKVINESLEVIENNLAEFSIPNKRQKRVFGVMVESLQNLYHHIDKPPQEANKSDRWASFIVSKSENLFFIKTRNFIDINKHLHLQIRMEQINLLDRDDLNNLYRLILSNRQFSEKGGGGLGLIEMVRRSGNKIDYEFEKFDNDFLVLYLCVQVNLK